MNMRKESGEITPDTEEILRIYTDFYKSLFHQTVPTPENTMCLYTEEMSPYTE